MLDRNIAVNAVPNAIVARLPQPKLRIANSERSIVGAAVRAW